MAEPCHTQNHVHQEDLLLQGLPRKGPRWPATEAAVAAIGSAAAATTTTAAAAAGSGGGGGCCGRERGRAGAGGLGQSRRGTRRYPLNATITTNTPHRRRIDTHHASASVRLAASRGSWNANRRLSRVFWPSTNQSVEIRRRPWTVLSVRAHLIGGSAKPETCPFLHDDPFCCHQSELSLSAIISQFSRFFSSLLSEAILFSGWIGQLNLPCIHRAAMQTSSFPSTYSTYSSAVESPPLSVSWLLSLLLLFFFVRFVYQAWFFFPTFSSKLLVAPFPPPTGPFHSCFLRRVLFSI